MKTSIGLFITGLHLVIICFFFELYSAIVKLNSELRLANSIYQSFFQTFSAPKSLKTGIILPLFKGKGVNANDKNNYRGITLFLTLCKIYEMILLNRSLLYDLGNN